MIGQCAVYALFEPFHVVTRLATLSELIREYFPRVQDVIHASLLRADQWPTARVASKRLYPRWPSPLPGGSGRTPRRLLRLPPGLPARWLTRRRLASGQAWRPRRDVHAAPRPRVDPPSGQGPGGL